MIGKDGDTFHLPRGNSDAGGMTKPSDGRYTKQNLLSAGGGRLTRLLRVAAVVAVIASALRYLGYV